MSQGQDFAFPVQVLEEQVGGADTAAPRIGVEGSSVGVASYALLWCSGLLHQPDLRQCLQEAGLSPRWVIATAWLLRSLLFPTIWSGLVLLLQAKAPKEKKVSVAMKAGAHSLPSEVHPQITSQLESIQQEQVKMQEAIYGQTMNPAPRASQSQVSMSMQDFAKLDGPPPKTKTYDLRLWWPSRGFQPQ